MKFPFSALAIMLATASGSSFAANYCGDLRNAFGPFDYTNSEFTQNLRTVESFHFTPEVEKLIKGASGSLGADLDYTLRAFPNHSKALSAVAKVALREKTPRVPGMNWSVECYFDRAIRFKPDDPGVRSIYGSYLYKLGRTDDAIAQLSEAIKIDPANGTAHHNLGLIYFHKKDYGKAALHAKKAEELGFPLSGLKNKLVEMGKWN